MFHKVVSVATYGRCSGIFDIYLSANLDMKLRVQDQGEDQRRPGKRLYVRIVKHVS